MDNPWPEPSELSHEKLVAILIHVQSILWAGDGSAPDPDKEWNSDTLEDIADVLEAAGLKPLG